MFRALTLFLALATTACSRIPDGSPEQTQAVVETLHTEGLIADPEVQKTMASFARKAQTGELTRDQSAALLAAWLREWEADHPDRAARARRLHRLRAEHQRRSERTDPATEP